MNIIKLSGALALVLLAGCDNRTDELQSKQGAVEQPRPVAERVFIRNAIVLGEGQPLVFDGHVVRYDLARNDRGVFDRYTIESSQSLMGLEAAVFADLARRGYTRRVRQETPERYLVNYLRKGAVPVVADYRAEKGSNKLSRLIVTVRTNR